MEAQPNARWSLDFVHDQFACGRRFRVLNVIDDVTRECLGAMPDVSISGRCVARELRRIVEDDNTERPRSALGYQAPAAFARHLTTTTDRCAEP